MIYFRVSATANAERQSTMATSTKGFTNQHAEDALRGLLDDTAFACVSEATPNIDEHEYSIRLYWGNAVYMLRTGKKRTALKRIVQDGQWSMGITRKESRELRKWALPVIAKAKECGIV